MVLLRSWVFGMQTVHRDYVGGTAQARVPGHQKANKEISGRCWNGFVEILGLRDANGASRFVGGDRTGKSACATKGKPGPHGRSACATNGKHGTAQAGVPVPPKANRDRTGRSACATKDKQGPHRQECLCTKDEQGNQSPVAVGEVLRR